jgi:addiction module HigA family antidote
MQAWLNSASYYALKLWAQIIKKGRQMMKRHPYPGELLREDVLMPLGIEITDAAQRLGMSRTALSRVINGRAGILASLIRRTVFQLAKRIFCWMDLGTKYVVARFTSNEYRESIGAIDCANAKRWD